MRHTSLSTRMVRWRVEDLTGTCCCPTGLMKPTLEKRFWSPERRERDTDVLPTCCFVAATKIGRGEGEVLGGFSPSVLVEKEDDEDGDKGVE